MDIMEGDIMATVGPSLLLSLLDVTDRANLNKATNPHAVKYHEFSDKQKKEVQKKLYEALYVITEYPALPQNRDLSMGTGKALARVLRGDLLPDPKLQAVDHTDNQIIKLREVLTKVVQESIDEIM
jgi:hypothetical protein